MRQAAFTAIIALPMLAYALRPQGLGKAVYARDRTFDLQHVRLELAFDLAAHKVVGTATLRLAPLNDGLEQVALDAVGLDITTVEAGGRPAAFQARPQQLVIQLATAQPMRKPMELTIRYSARPKKGLTFVLPDQQYPGRPSQIWSQGFPDDNRFWFPVYDFPNDKTTSELLVTVPATWEAVANGRLLSVRENRAAGTKTFHWLQSKPHSTYLISFVAGELAYKTEDAAGVSLAYYVPRGLEAAIPRSFGRSADAMRFFVSRLGPYPWDKYAQIVVEDSIYGGMENTSATTLGLDTLLEPELLADYQASTDATIAHELAHQWFGDLVTPADFRNLWLSEGFATYFSQLWSEHYYGKDQADCQYFRTASEIASVPELQRFPLVRRPNQEGDPVGLLAYQKGAWVLRMLHHQLGEAAFWRGIHHYLDRYSFQNVRSPDFLEAVEEATGRNFEWLFDQYVYAPGHPELHARWRYDASRQHIELEIRQTQERPAFHLPLEIELSARKRTERFTVWISRDSETFDLPCDTKPDLVLIDPDVTLLKKLVFEKDDAEWMRQLLESPRAVSRVEAAVALSRRNAAPDVVAALARTGSTDAFPGVRLEAAQALSVVAAAAAVPALQKMLADSAPQVRAAAAGALAQHKRDPQSAGALLETARRDASPVVRAATLQAIARLKPPGAFDLLRPFLSVDSPRELVRRAALSAIASLSEPRATDLFLEWSARDKPVRVRLAALGALGHARGRNEEARQCLLEALNDSYFRIRGAAMEALRERRDPKAAEALERMAQQEPVDDLAARAGQAAAQLRETGKHR